MPYPSEHSARLKDPSAFDPKSFRRVNGKFGAGVDVIFGKLKGGKGTMVIQTIRFDAKRFTPAQVRTWLKDHKYSASVEAASGEAKKGEAKKEITQKHLAGQHSQKRHGWRFGATAKFPEGEDRGEYEKRALGHAQRTGKKLTSSAAPKPTSAKPTQDFTKFGGGKSEADRILSRTPRQRKQEIKHLSSFPLTKLRKYQDLNRKQQDMARKQGNDLALRSLQERERDYAAAVDMREFGTKERRTIAKKELSFRFAKQKQELTASVAIATATPFAHYQHRNLFITTTKEGQTRWTTFSSSAFRDRDGEIVSMKALLADVERADHDRDYGPLRFWHLILKDQRGVDIGDCDFNMMRGHILIESGTFRSPQIAKTVKENADKLEVSIGFIHPAAEPDQDGVYHRIRRFERSLVPKGRVANRTTRLIV